MSFNSTCTLAIGSLDNNSSTLAVLLSAMAASLMAIYVLLVCSSRDWLVSHHIEGDTECPRCVRPILAAPAPLARVAPYKGAVNLELI
jgi:hypothetical protein